MGVELAGIAKIEIDADIEPLKRSLQKASSEVKKWSDGLMAFGTTLSGISAAIGTPFLGAMKHFAEVGDEMSRMSAKTGITVEALSELKHAAKLSDVSFESLGVAFKKMAVLLTNMHTMSGAITLGLLRKEAEDFENLSPEKAFMKLADAIARLPDPNERAAAAIRVFGKSGTDLLPMLENGSKGIEALREEARKMGLVMSGGAAQSAQRLDDEMKKLNESIGSMVNAIGSSIAPFMTSYTSYITDIVKATRDWTKENQALAETLGKTGLVAGAVGGAAVGIAGAGKLLPGSIGAAAATGFVADIALAGVATMAVMEALGVKVYGIGDIFRKIVIGWTKGTEQIAMKFNELVLGPIFGKGLVHELNAGLDEQIRTATRKQGVVSAKVPDNMVRKINPVPPDPNAEPEDLGSSGETRNQDSLNFDKDSIIQIQKVWKELKRGIFEESLKKNPNFGTLGEFLGSMGRLGQKYQKKPEIEWGGFYGGQAAAWSIGAGLTGGIQGDKEDVGVKIDISNSFLADIADSVKHMNTTYS